MNVNLKPAQRGVRLDTPPSGPEPAPTPALEASEWPEAPEASPPPPTLLRPMETATSPLHSRRVANAPEFDPFDLAPLRLSQDFASAVGVKNSSRRSRSRNRRKSGLSGPIPTRPIGSKRPSWS